MMHLEETLAKAYQLKGDLEEAQRYRALADNRHATDWTLDVECTGRVLRGLPLAEGVGATPCRPRRCFRCILEWPRPSRPTQ